MTAPGQGTSSLHQDHLPLLSFRSALLTAVRRQLVVLVYISLMIRVENIFTKQVAVLMSLEKCLFLSLAHFFRWVASFAIE